MPRNRNFGGISTLCAPLFRTAWSIPLRLINPRTSTHIVIRASSTFSQRYRRMVIPWGERTPWAEVIRQFPVVA
jgi:hypothetical protein